MFEYPPSSSASEGGINALEEEINTAIAAIEGGGDDGESGDVAGEGEAGPAREDSKRIWRTVRLTW